MIDKNRIYVAATGFVMGVAEVIPGVSGGTIAFVAGIYEELLRNIDGFRKAMIELPSKGLSSFTENLNLRFLVALFLGMVVGIAIGVAVVTHMLEHYPPIIWGFFFGLIVGSSIYMLAQVKVALKTIVWAIAGGVLAFGLGSLSYGVGSESPWFVFLSAAIAITALVLPGISGSFMLLMLGMYTFIIKDTIKGLTESIDADKILTLLAFGLGALTGLFSIARVLKWLFETYRDATIAVLTGFMIGSLPKIWPWRNANMWMDRDTGEILQSLPEGPDHKIISEILVMPGDYYSDPYTLIACLTCVLGAAAIGLFALAERRQ